MTGSPPCTDDPPWSDPAAPDSLRVLLTPIAGDVSGEVQRAIAGSFDGRAGYGLRRTCTTLPMRDGTEFREADALRATYGADVVIWGQQVSPGATVALRVAADQGLSDLARRAWHFPRDGLGAGEGAIMTAPLQALALSIATPVLGRWNTLAANLLPPLLPGLRTLATSPPPKWDDHRVLEHRWITTAALIVGGDATRDAALYRDAAGMARLALDSVSAAAAPDAWGALLNHLGNAFRRIAGSADGDEAYDAVEAAIDAYRQALTVRTREASPLAWATTRNNLGLALTTLAPWGGDDALREAITAFDDALTVRTRERFPEAWAFTRAERAKALGILSLFGDDTALAEARETIRDVRSAVPRAQTPMAWASVAEMEARVHALGRDEASLRDAAAAFRDALMEFTRDRDPMLWADTLAALARTLAAIGRRGDEPSLKEAAAAQRLALTVFTRERVPDTWAATQADLGDTLLALARRGDAAAADDAVIAYRHALSVITHDTSALQWAVLHQWLGDALRIAGERPGGDAALRDAIAAYRQAMVEFTQEDNPYRWAALQWHTGIALTLLAERGAGEDVTEAIAALHAARDVFDLEDDMVTVARVDVWLDRARAFSERR
jgi:hypothetical protein